MSGALLDASALIPLFARQHVFHQLARAYAHSIQTVAVCPITEGSLLRYYYRVDNSANRVGGQRLLETLRGFPGFMYVHDDISFSDFDLGPISGHNQVTDAYLVHLARAHNLKLATLDKSLKAIYPEVELIV